VLMLIEGRTFITEALMGSNLTSKLYVWGMNVYEMGAESDMTG
jgi:hypothetical protein